MHNWCEYKIQACESWLWTIQWNCWHGKIGQNLQRLISWKGNISNVEMDTQVQERAIRSKVISIVKEVTNSI